MTPAQQRKHNENVQKLNAAIQRKIHIEVEKQKSRVLALETATRLKPSEAYINPLSGGNQRITPKYDVLSEAERIYTWLVKDLK